MATVARDRLRALIDTVVDSLDDDARGEELARRVHFSRFHFDRLLASALGESPGAFRRRLLLERAAWELGHGAGVTEVAFRAGYASLEAFSRAFSRAYERLIYSKETWTASLAGREAPGRQGNSIDCLRRRLEDAGTEFAQRVREIRDRGAWDTAFVDALCDPPESFTYGGMVAHVLTWSAHRRHVLIGALRSLGAADTGSGDPIEWERRPAA